MNGLNPMMAVGPKLHDGLGGMKVALSVLWKKENCQWQYAPAFKGETKEEPLN